MYIVRAVFRTLALALVFSAAIAVHECGHYMFVRASGIPVAEVCLGEGPILVEGYLPDGALLHIRAIPFSGFVQPSIIHMMLTPPSRATSICMFSAGILHTTIWACIMFMLFAALSGLKPGFWRPLWFGLRRSFIALLVFPFQVFYGVLTFQSQYMIMESWPVRILTPFLLDDYFEHEENGSRTILPHGVVQWIGMIAVVFFTCSLLGMIPISMVSDPAMIIRLALSYFPGLPFDPLTALIVIQVAIVSIVFLFLIQCLLIVLMAMLRRWLDARKARENQED